VRISSRKGLVVVRSGKGDAYREVELNVLLRGMLDEWIAQRATIAAVASLLEWLEISLVSESAMTSRVTPSVHARERTVQRTSQRTVRYGALG
jgi:hypothetical protein